jgi:hypothetical protein
VCLTWLFLLHGVQLTAQHCTPGRSDGKHLCSTHCTGLFVQGFMPLTNSPALHPTVCSNFGITSVFLALQK